MADPFVGEIRIVGFDFNPKQWAPCDGRLLPISQNTALFALLGTIYGGDGKQTFALPNLQGRAPMHFGQGPGLTLRELGEAGGSAQASVSASQMPSHKHGVMMTAAGGEEPTPAGQVLGANSYYGPASNVVPMLPTALPPAGGSQPHNNMMPYQALNFVIALQGVFPPRS
jgi:microcystin-dependent protein